MKFLYLFLVVTIVASCHKDVNDDTLNTVTENQITVPYTFNEIEGTMVGFVYGEDNDPISNASVSIYSGTASTNEYGVFQLANVKMDGQGTLVVVTKEGYQDGADFIYPNDEGAGTSRLKLFRKAESGSFNSADGGTVEFGDDGLVTFSPNSISQQNGSSYNGEVEASVKSTNPLNPSFNDELAGSLIGLDSEARHRVLGTFGSVNISLFDISNISLGIKSDKTFTIKFPIAQDQLTYAEEEISVWKYDESTGYWNEIGLARKEDQFYIIEVSEGGNYMFADPYPLTHYCAKLVNEVGIVAKNYKFNILIDNKLCATGISDNDGFLCSKVPMGEELILQIIHPHCNQILETKLIGAFDEPNNGGDVIIDTQQDIRSGSVLCTNTAVSNALIIIKNGETTLVQTTDGSGLFNLNLGDITCNQDEVFEVFAIKDGQVSPVIEVSQAVMLDIKLEICESECEYTVSFYFEKDDACSSGNYDRVRAVIDGGSGQYSYLWNDGGVVDNNSSSTLAGVEACVTITDLETGCIVNHCETTQEYRSLELLSISSYNGSCTQNGGVIVTDVIGGEGPYNYKWVSNIGYNSTIPNPANLWPGLYELTLTDVNECEVTSEVEIYDVTSVIVFDIEDYCDFTTISVIEGEGYGPYMYAWEWAGGNSDESSVDAALSGEYRVTISDQNGCTRSGSSTISNVGIDVEIYPNFGCDIGTVFFDVLDPSYQYFYESVANSDRFDMSQVGGQIQIPILDSGYRYFFGAEDISVGCEDKEIIELPHFEGLQIQNIQNVSCTACNDGFIEVLLDKNQDCTGGCVAGATIIIDKITGADMTNVNNQNELAAGTYYVIVTDENTGCYIAHEEAVVE